MKLSLSWAYRPGFRTGGHADACVQMQQLWQQLGFIIARPHVARLLASCMHLLPAGDEY